ncbi:replication protein [Candidatus Pantoea multigeneris]|uniref:Replication protein n=1 Tax=Candidatus Pantoea multigeneris TaxID=2608357 RepID=A0ABX0R680_9GAMM|nr:replication protein [Pantoea multigeneris]NIF20284.1 replication protein [Pantoea multigeneris]
MNNTAEIINFRAPVRREEHRVADLDDGYVRLATLILEELAGADLTKRQFKVLLAVIRLTYGWNKSRDKIANSQLSEIAKLPVKRVSETRVQLLKMKVLTAAGHQIGINKNVSEWDIPQSEGLSLKSGDKKSPKAGDGNPSKQGDSIDIIPKTVKTDPPKAPKGEFSEEVISQAKQVLEYYNETTGATCRSAEPFAVLLSEKPTRAAYTVADLKLVVLWVARTWPRRGNSVAKPANICRVNRFDGYLSDADIWQQNTVDIDCGAVVEAWNEITEGRLPPAELDHDRAANIREMTGHLKHKTVEAFRMYFSAFMSDAREFHFGGPDGSGWRASFDYVMKLETLRKVREKSL